MNNERLKVITMWWLEWRAMGWMDLSQTSGAGELFLPMAGMGAFCQKVKLCIFLANKEIILHDSAYQKCESNYRPKQHYHRASG